MIESPLGVRCSLPPALEDELGRACQRWQAEDRTRRLFARDASLWTGGQEGRWLGWLDVVAREQRALGELEELGRAVAGRGLERALLLGMGGSSLGPEVLADVLGRSPGFPRLRVLDSTDPGTLHAALSDVDWRRTLVLAASKSGTTLETRMLLDYCLGQLEAAGVDPGAHLLALSDPGSPLLTYAREQGFWKLFTGDPEIGGRFSVLSRFGLVPAAVMGIDLGRLLDSAARSVAACQCESAALNPGVVLGLALAVAARAGRDKVTLLPDPALRSLGGWLEQLLAESSGKDGRGLLPVDLEPLGKRYGADRLFLALELARDGTGPRIEGEREERARLLTAEGHPVISCRLSEPYDLGAAFFTFEVAAVVACSWLGVEPFEQPDVETSKMLAAELASSIERQGRLAPEPETARAGVLSFFAEGGGEGARGPGDAIHLLAKQLAGLAPPGYLALLAFLRPDQERTAALSEIRGLVRDRTGAATMLGYGPRYLHSTGQAYKGGPPGGVFLVLTDEPDWDTPVPGRRLSFRQVRDAQAVGDARALQARGRKVLRVHLGGATVAGLGALRELVELAIAV